MELREYQRKALDAVVARLQETPRVLLQAATGAGKCLGAGTPVLTFDGRTVPVERLAVGDLLMGPDSRPRKVVSLASGTEEMYRIVPDDGGVPFTANGSHVLSLRIAGPAGGEGIAGPGGREWRPGDVADVPVDAWLGAPEPFRQAARGRRAGPVEFPPAGRPLAEPPRLLGLMLGGMEAPWGHGLGGYRLVADHVPHAYLTASAGDRLELLAGALDADGFLSEGRYDLYVKSERLAMDFAFLARSLGLAARVERALRRLGERSQRGRCWRLSLSGALDTIPSDIPARQADQRIQARGGALEFGFGVWPLGPGKYYGFELEGPDRLFLLGDFTVTHNTVIFAELIRRYMTAYPGMRILILAHRRELIAQARDKLLRVWPEGEPHVGVACASAGAVDTGRTVTVASVQTLARRRLAGPVDLLVVDECFPAGTLVDGRPIETIRVGDRVTSYSHGAGAVETREVTETFVGGPASLVKVLLTDGTSVVCTANHPFFTRRGYVKAGALDPEQEVLRLYEEKDGSDGGQAEGRGVAWVGVQGVEVYEQGSAEGSGGVRGQGAVFNLEVEGNGNYFAEGVLVHNCHHLPNLEAGGQYHEVIGRLLKDNPDLWILGVTATPFRTGHGYIYGDRCREGRTNFFPSLDWAVRLNDLIEEGHLCRIRWKIPVDLERDLARVKVSRGEYDARALGREMSRPVHLASALDAYRRYGEGRGKALVFAVTIEHARTLAGILSAEGPAAAVYDGLCPRERAAVLRDFERGGLRFLVNVGILTEGWDSPAVDLIMMCRPTKSVGLYVQMVGRGTRTREGKDSVLVLDLSDNRKEHGDPSDPKVREGGGRKGEEGGAGGPVKVCPACKELVPAPSRECPVCGHAFPAKAAARPPALEESPEMVEAEGRVPERRDRLEGWCLVPHVSARGNRMARLDLHLEGRAAPVSHWLDFEGSGSARGRERARLWWRLHSRAGLYDPTPPGTVDEAVRRARTELRLPERVTLRTDPNGYRKVSGW